MGPPSSGLWFHPLDYELPREARFIHGLWKTHGILAHASLDSARDGHAAGYAANHRAAWVASSIAQAK